MRKIVKENQPFENACHPRRSLELARPGAWVVWRSAQESEQVQARSASEIPEDEEISLYQNGDFSIFAPGRTSDAPAKCKTVKVMAMASAFYKGDENKPQLQRVYGTASRARTSSNDIWRGSRRRTSATTASSGVTGLFHIDEAVGQGLVLWKPKGAIVRRALQDFILGS